MEIKIALAGNPNCGKTTMFNDLTGSNQYVGNWPGVTVEKKEGRLKGHKDIIIQDLPGIYSLSPYTLEEVVARNYLVGEKPDAILNIVDGTNIERNLYLTTQLIELGIPVIIALNMVDLVRKNGDKIDVAKLSKALGCEIVETSALKGEGSKEVAERAAGLAASKSVGEMPSVFVGSVEHAIAHIEESIEDKVDPRFLRWYAIKLFERDEKVIEELKLPKDLMDHINEHIKDCESELDDDAESIITNQRYAYIAKVVGSSVKKKNSGRKMNTSDKIDRIVTNRVAALPIFAIVMFVVYWVAMGPFGSFLTDWTNDVLGGAWLTDGSRALLEGWGCAGWLTGLVSDGIIAGVGAVLGFVPQMLVLFLMLSILEDVGYMARVAFIMDRIFRKFGLSGKSFIPMLIGSGCGVPGVMASRTIENERDRRMTIMTTCFIPCGAKMPIIGLIAGALFGGSGIVAVSAYFIGVAAVIISGVMLKKTKPFAGEAAPFVMELPAYHAPAASNVLRATWERGWSFIKRAGTVIVVSSIIIWALSSLGSVGGKFGMVDTLFEDDELVTDEYVAQLAEKMDISGDEVSSMDASILAQVGNSVSFIFKPLGFGNWKPTVATITGLVAKEEVVSTFGVLYNYDDNDGEEELEENGDQIWDNVAADYNSFSGGHGKLAAFSFMIFNLLCAPCFAAMGAIKREMNNGKWTLAAIGYMCGFAYVIALIVYQLGKLFSGDGFGIGTAAAIILLAGLIYLLFRKNRYENTPAASQERAVNNA
ncbi:MAG: ferrous iron transport protein B [Oscillospiraceae bacterium]